MSWRPLAGGPRVATANTARPPHQDPDRPGPGSLAAGRAGRGGQRSAGPPALADRGRVPATRMPAASQPRAYRGRRRAPPKAGMAPSRQRRRATTRMRTARTARATTGCCNSPAAPHGTGAAHRVRTSRANPAAGSGTAPIGPARRGPASWTTASRRPGERLTGEPSGRDGPATANRKPIQPILRRLHVWREQ
jgi:hypothetical protein